MAESHKWNRNKITQLLKNKCRQNLFLLILPKRLIWNCPHRASTYQPLLWTRPADCSWPHDTDNIIVQLRQIVLALMDNKSISTIWTTSAISHMRNLNALFTSFFRTKVLYRRFLVLHIILHLICLVTNKIKDKIESSLLYHIVQKQDTCLVA